MKQHLLPMQACHFTKETFYSFFDELVDRDDWHKYHHKKMTIGKMIELLHKKYKVEIVGGENFLITLYDKDQVIYKTTRKELVDALYFALLHVTAE